MTTSVHCLILNAETIVRRIDELSEILVNCVNNGASVSFTLPFGYEKATVFWNDVAQSVNRSERIVLGAEDEQGALVGTVQLITSQPENQPHRADVAKLLVHRSARRGGIARNLMAMLEVCAREQHKSLLVLDTATGSDAELFYHSCGWQRSGVIPNYAQMPDGTLTGTTIFYKSEEIVATN